MPMIDTLISLVTDEQEADFCGNLGVFLYKHLKGTGQKGQNRGVHSIWNYSLFFPFLKFYYCVPSEADVVIPKIISVGLF